MPEGPDDWDWWRDVWGLAFGFIACLVDIFGRWSLSWFLDEERVRGILYQVVGSWFKGDEW